MASNTPVDNSSQVKPKVGCCQLCQRDTHLSFHHLIPRKAHRRKAFRKRYTAAQLQQGINICKLCHNAIHKFYDELWLARKLNTLALLQADEQLQRHIQWTSKQRVAIETPGQARQSNQIMQTINQQANLKRTKREDL